MAANTSLDTLFRFLSALFGPTPDAAIDIVESTAASGSMPAECATMTRLAALYPSVDMLWFYRLHNVWTTAGAPPLKPNPTMRNVLLLADFTAGQLPPLLSIMCAARGVHIDLELAAFDSVEQEILSTASNTYAVPRDLVIVCLSPHWLARYLGNDAMTTRERLDSAIDTLRMLLETLTSRIDAPVLIANFPAPVLGAPGAHLAIGTNLGSGFAVGEVNRWLATAVPAGTSVANVADAIFEAGGRTAVGLTNHLRARIPFEPAGMVAVARELASAASHLCGKSPRAIVTDWDNTLWGGEIADVGAHGIVCGRDSAEGLGYIWVQEHLKGLQRLGILLAAATRNDPAVRDLVASNSDLALAPDDFASVQVGIGAKSAAIERISADLGFGPEFMVFVDDGLFDIAEVVAAHPYIDVVKAGPQPEMTLALLTASRLFNAVSLSDEDFARSRAAAALKEQRELRAGFDTLDDFLRRIHIRVTATRLTDANIARVEQLFQKTNQFNLTTKRYSAGELRQLQARRAEIGVFAYEDAFGPQGIIGAVIVRRDHDALRIDSWLMSCRVLNRTVEHAAFEWILKRADGVPIIGEYRPTEQNALVRDLYQRLGCTLIERDEPSRVETWRLDVSSERRAPAHFIELQEA